MTAIRTGLLLVLVFTLAQLTTGHHAVATPGPAVLVSCSDGPTCAVPPAPAGPVRTVNIRWVHILPAVTS